MQNLEGHVKIKDIERFLKLLDTKITEVEDEIKNAEYKFEEWCKDAYTKRYFRKDRTLEECKSIGLSDKWSLVVWEYRADISSLRQNKRRLLRVFQIATNCLVFGDELNVSFEDYYSAIE